MLQDIHTFAFHIQEAVAAIWPMATVESRRRWGIRKADMLRGRRAGLQDTGRTSGPRSAGCRSCPLCTVCCAIVRLLVPQDRPTTLLQHDTHRQPETAAAMTGARGSWCTQHPHAGGTQRHGALELNATISKRQSEVTTCCVLHRMSCKHSQMPAGDS